MATCALCKDLIPSGEGSQVVLKNTWGTELLKISEKDKKHISGVEARVILQAEKELIQKPQMLLNWWHGWVKSPYSGLRSTRLTSPVCWALRALLLPMLMASTALVLLLYCPLPFGPQPERQARQPRSGKAFPPLLAPAWDLMLKSSTMGGCSPPQLHSADSPTEIPLGKAYLEHPQLFLVVYNTGFGSQSVIRYADVIHKHPHCVLLIE